MIAERAVFGIQSPMIFPITTITELTAVLLGGAGLHKKDAETAADIFRRATLRNVGHHDIYFLPQRLDWLTAKGVNPHPHIELESSHGATEVWNGDKGLGEVCCAHITSRAMDLARSNGIGFATIRNSNHFLAASPYCEIGVENGFLILVFSNTDPCMSFPGGDKNVIGNNPMGFGLPRTGGGKLMLDVCMAYSSLGNLRTYAREGKQIPGHWAKDSEGNWTTDPQAALDGSIQPMAAHKGFGLALLTETLTGILSGGHTGNRVAKGGGINSHNQSVIAFDLGAFGGPDTISGRVEDLTSRLKADDGRIRIPGEHSHHEEQRLARDGVDLHEKLIHRLREWQETLGVRKII